VVDHMKSLPFKEFEFQGFLGHRRIVSFGWRYDFNGGGLQKTEDMPPFLLPIRERAAEFAGLEPTDIQQVLLTEYRPGVQMDGTRTAPYSARWLEYRYCHRAPSGCAERSAANGSAPRSSLSRVPPTCSPARREPSGSTAFPASKRSDTPSPSGTLRTVRPT
jgi:hypothetical protein